MMVWGLPRLPDLVVVESPGCLTIYPQLKRGDVNWFLRALAQSENQTASYSIRALFSSFLDGKVKKKKKEKKKKY